MSDIEEAGYWMVHCHEHGPARCMHSDYDSARREAKRLAMLNPGRRFFVLAAVEMVRMPAQSLECRLLDPVEFDDGIPF